MISNKKLVQYLSGLSSSAGFTDRIKIRYRPLICPFGKLLSYAEKKSSVFDVGCGSGQFCALIRRFTAVKQIMGIEISKKLIDQAGQLNAGEERQMRFKVFDGKNIPADIQGYELVYMIDVLHHIPLNAQQDFLSALCEKMASGAALVLKDIDAGSPLVIFNKIHDLIFAGETGHERSVSLTKKMLMQAGFQLNEQFNIRTLVYPHTFFICSRP